MAREDIPRVLHIAYTGTPHSKPSYAVYISKHQFNKLALWVRGMTRFFEAHDSTRHVWIRIEAKDELEAIMRFRKLWVGLPKKEQDQ